MKKNDILTEKISVPDGIFPYTTKEAEALKITDKGPINKEMHFPKTMKELRNKEGYSQQQAADSIGVTKSTIGLYENGDNIPDIKTLYKISKLYDVSVGYLLGIDPEPTSNMEIQGICKVIGLSDRAIQNIIDLTSGVSPDTGETTFETGAGIALRRLLENENFFGLLGEIGLHFIDAENLKNYESEIATKVSDNPQIYEELDSKDALSALKAGISRMRGESVTLNPIDHYNFIGTKINELFVKVVKEVVDDHVSSINVSESVVSRRKFMDDTYGQYRFYKNSSK